ncbi:MAG TPA: hypothetical protein VMU14_20195 [Acidimicrobiales bacterium]|nr:hypothetical protein [Acidimicrobiales bacterium]
MTRALAALATLALAAVISVHPHGRAPKVGALAVLGTHVRYEASLVAGVLPRLPAADAGAAVAVHDSAAAQAAHLGAVLAHDGYPPARAQAVWARLIGNGAPPPGRVLLYVCSVHTQSDAAELAATPPGGLAATLGAIELTLLVEGQELARQVGGALGAQAAAQQRHALHLLAPLLVPSDRAYALSA